MSQSLLRISREAGDANVGRTILRLAALAASTHRLQRAVEMAGRGSDIAGPAHGRAGRPEGATEHGCDGDVRSLPASAPAAHTEVSP
ncbi:MAG: hypothetical protein IT442_08610 [Phycisphaeraceae bacterium]|nr:hypothetical protein [Phycisphaeraceae bacterium]